MIPTRKAHTYDKAVKKDVNQIRNIIQHKHNIDILFDEYYSCSNPSNGLPTTYSEMCVKDDYRIELRNGPNINSSFQDLHDWIQQSKGIIEIISKVMNPLSDYGDYDNVSNNIIYIDDSDNDEQLKENFKQWDIKNSYINTSSYNALFNNNYSDDNNKNNDYTTPRINSTSFLVTFPKCDDEEILNANDTTTNQLFQYYCTTKKNSKKEDLPPHSINVCIPTSPSSIKSNGSNLTGGTAFVAGSHQSYKNNAYIHNKKLLYNNIMRPSIVPGDIILFDSRVLHFGLANNASLDHNNKFWNTILCLNYTKSWFVDPSKKDMWNDDKNPSLFSDS